MAITKLNALNDPVAALRADGLNTSEWRAGPGAFFPRHKHASAKRLYVLSGSINFNGEEVIAPHGIRIAAGFEHSAVAGSDGVECVEAFE